MPMRRGQQVRCEKGEGVISEAARGRNFVRVRTFLSGSSPDCPVRVTPATPRCSQHYARPGREEMARRTTAR